MCPDRHAVPTLLLDRLDGLGHFVVIALVNLATDAVLKPAIVTAIYVWLTWLMAAPGRWRALVEGDQPQRSGAGAMAGAVAGTGHH